jgi:glyoxylase-like metal-dependent hydrolase (beta-lactamase superfamily II)
MRALTVLWARAWPGLVALTLLIAAGLLIVERRGSFSSKFISIFDSRARRLVRSAITVVPGIYLLGDLSPSAAYVIETSQGLVLVDSGLDADAKLLKSQMANLGLDWKHIRAILLTHVHGDHSGGAEALRAATGAKTYAGEGDACALRIGAPREAFFSTYYMPDNTPHSTTIDVPLKGGEDLEFGDVRIQCLATPGHTPGSICYLLERKNLRALFAGDVIMMLRGDDAPRSELGKPLGTYSAYLAPRYRGNAEDSLRSLRGLRSMRVPDLVLPGHPGADVTPQDPSLSQAGWESLLDRGIHDMETLLARSEADGADFLDGIPKQLLPDLYYLGDFGGAAVYALYASSKLFLIDAPGGPGLIEFLGARLRRLGREVVAPTAVLLTSCNPVATTGLEEIIKKWHPQVVAEPGSFEKLTASCPAGTVFLSAWELPERGWFTVTPISLDGRGDEAIAYQLSWGGKSVLFSGRIPIKVSYDAQELLVADLASPKGDVRGYFTSLTRLQKLRPDLWLPTVPVDGQNANLYDTDWERTIEDNLYLVSMILSAQRNRR